MEYTNLDVWMDRAGDAGYGFRGISPDHGEARAFLSADGFLEALAAKVEEVFCQFRGAASCYECGTLLYEALFSGEMGRLLESCCRSAIGRRNCGVRLRLRIEPPELAVLPWELMHGPKPYGLFAANMQFPLVRYIDLNLSVPELETRFPLHLLAILPRSCPPFPEIMGSQERELLTRAVAPLVRDRSVKIVWLDGHEGAPVTLEAISDKLLEDTFHVIHFIGHGRFSGDRATLLLNGDAGGMLEITDGQVANLLHNHKTLKLLLLNSCQGATLSSVQPLVGMAPQLVKEGLPAVIGMQRPIDDKWAVHFSREFYHALFRSTQRGRVDVAVSHARNLLATKFPDEPAFAVPVLYMRARHGMLFDPVADTWWRRIPWSSEEKARARVRVRTHEDNLEAFDPEAGSARDREQQEMRWVLTRLRTRQVCGIVAVATAFFCFCLLWVSLFDAMNLDTWAESYILWLRDVLTEKPVPLDERIVMVVVDQETEEVVGKRLDSSWRADHARLIDKAVGAEAKMIVFDLVFSSPDPQGDELLARAMDRARGRGVPVIVGAAELNQGAFRVPENIAGAASLGVPCVGKKLGLARTMLLFIEKPDGKRFLSLPLQAYLKLNDDGELRAVDEEHRRLIWQSEGRPQHTEFFSELTVITKDQPCRVMEKGDKVGDLFLVLSDASVLSHRQYPYHRVLLDAASENAKQAFKNKILIVGHRNAKDVHRIRRGLRTEIRYGYELHADALNTLLQGVRIRPVGPAWQFGIMLLMGLLGAGTSGIFRARFTGRLLIALCGLYLGGAVWLAAAGALLVNPLYHLTALFLSSRVATAVVGRKLYGTTRHR